MVRVFILLAVLTDEVGLRRCVLLPGAEVAKALPGEVAKRAWQAA